MGAFSKELWITVAVCLPVILWTLFLAQSRGGNIEIPAFQIAVLLVGGVVIWRMGGRILETVTKVWERINPTRVWDVQADSESDQLSINPSQMSFRERQYGDDNAGWQGPAVSEERGNSADGLCAHCGSSLRANAVYCRHCGKKRLRNLF
jgi:ribosomal protein L40E